MLGVPDERWGERVAMVAVVKEEAVKEAAKATTATKAQPLELPAIRAWLADKLAPYKAPTLMRLVHEIPRNPMGKVNKKQLRVALFPAVSKE